MELVKTAFARLKEALTIEAVDKIINELDIEKNKMDDDKYPKIEFKITGEELKTMNIINNNKLEFNITNTDPLTRLLYAVLWKNGDLQKIRHVVEGILSVSESNKRDESGQGEAAEKEDGIVFYQFGKYLTKAPGEPIVDQHVLRAFGIFKAGDNEEEIQKYRRLSIISKREKGLIEAYKTWLR